MAVVRDVLLLRAVSAACRVRFVRTWDEYRFWRVVALGKPLFVRLVVRCAACGRLVR